MKYGRYGWSYLFLSWGLGIVFAWIGIDMLRHPFDWIGYLPAALPFGLTREVGLKMNAAFDIAIGASLLLKFWPRLIAFLAVGHLAVILLLQGINAVIIRDVGLLGGALALFFWPQHGYRRKWHIFKRRHNTTDEV